MASVRKNTDPVLGGVNGKCRCICDLLGKSANTASGMESHGMPGEIQVTEAARDRLDGQFSFIDGQKQNSCLGLACAILHKLD